MNQERNWLGSLMHFKRLASFFATLLVVLQVTAATSATVERISRNDLKPLKDGMPGEQGLKKEVVIASGVKMTASIEVTTKGNGTLRIGNLNLKVFDSHNDGNYYEEEMLKVEFADLDGDGKRELVVSGIVCFTDEKGDKVLRREAVVFIYALQLNRTFKPVYQNTDVRID